MLLQRLRTAHQRVGAVDGQLGHAFQAGGRRRRGRRQEDLVGEAAIQAAGCLIRLGRLGAAEARYKQLGELVQAEAAQGRPPLSDESQARLRAGRQQLIGEGLDPKVVDTLVEWIRTGDDADLHRIQVRERARVWKLPEVEMLRTALHATRAGLLDLSWDTICPHCRGLREETGKLSQVEASGHCEVCEVDFTTDQIEAVEVTFRVHPSIRDVPERLYCSAEPATNSTIESM